MRRRDLVKAFCAVGSSFVLEPLSRRGLLCGQEQTTATKVRRVLVMFKCHFDCGFIDTQTRVVGRYFQEYFPEAMRIAAAQRQAGQDHYVWTTGSWLLYEYLEQAAPQQRRQMEQAILAGDIAWHALPFSWQTELMDASMVAGSLGLSQSLDRRFGRTTTGSKMTDVPGHTRGIIRPLAEHGIKFLDVGVNGVCTPPAVPPIFVWRDSSDKELIVCCHHDYGGIVAIPGSDIAIAIMVRGDNSGPHSPDEIRQIYRDLREQFPNAVIQAANLTAIADAIAPYSSQFPVLMQEIGDTWIYGVSSDPVKLARYREMMRLRQEWITQRKFAVADATDVRLLRSLLLEVEHTWGTDTKTWLDFDHYTNHDLMKVLDSKNYKIVQFSWEEKRKDLFVAIETLPAELKKQAKDNIASLVYAEPKLISPERLLKDSRIETKRLIVSLDSTTGAIIKLCNKKTGRDWASPDHPIGLFSYQTLSKQDYDLFLKSYITLNAETVFKDFGKPNIEKFGAESATWFPTLKRFQYTRTERGHQLLSHLEIIDSAGLRSGRVAWPRAMYLEMIVPEDEPVIDIHFSWYGKPANRLPEALWLTFRPYKTSIQNWLFDKLGEWIAPTEIVAGGNRHMHAISSQLIYKDTAGALSIETFDAPLLSLDVKTPVYFSNDQPNLNNGIHFSLFNNGWGTNYVMWFAEDMHFRFRLNLS